ncbi:MAG: glycine-rich protein, partial [Bacilli bacterium]
ITIDIITKAKNNTSKAIANAIITKANLYYKESFIDDIKAVSINKLYNLVNIYKNNDIKEVYINKNGLVAFSFIYNNKCYKKEFFKEVEIKNKKQYKLLYTTPDDINPTVSFDIKKGTFNKNGWANKDFEVDLLLNDDLSGIYKYTWCLDTKVCIPNQEVKKNKGSILINHESANNKLCVIAYDKMGNKSKPTCTEELKLDKTPPQLGNIKIKGNLGLNNWYTSDITIETINGSDLLSGHDLTKTNIDIITSNTKGTSITLTSLDKAGNEISFDYLIKLDKDKPKLTAKEDDIKIFKGESNQISSYYNTPIYSLSGGSMNCEITNTNTLLVGKQTVICQAIGDNGLKESVTKEINVIENKYTFNYTNKEEVIMIPISGNYIINTYGASGTIGNTSTIIPTAGKGANLEAEFYLNEGDLITVIVGGMGSVTKTNKTDGTSGAGGGGTFVFKQINTITNPDYQFTKNNINYEVLLVTAGGGGSNDTSYQNKALNGLDGIGSTWYSPNNHIAFSTALAPYNNVLGINQFIINNSNGNIITKNSVCIGGYGGGNCSDDTQSYGGGWYGFDYKTYSYSTGNHTKGLTGANNKNGYATITFKNY